MRFPWQKREDTTQENSRASPDMALRRAEESTKRAYLKKSEAEKIARELKRIREANQFDRLLLRSLRPEKD